MHRHLTLATASLLALSACGSQPAALAPALTKAQAAQVLARFQTINNRANTGLDANLLAGAETGVQLDMDRADYLQHRATRKKLKSFSYTTPAYYIPRQAGYPRWFAVTAMSGATRHALVFTQERAGAPWLLAADPFASSPLNRIALDGQGYATAVAPGDTRSGIAPGRVPAMHAATLNNGATGMAAGPFTSAAHDALAKVKTALGKRGVQFGTRFEPDSRGVFALRTSGGGTLVWYTLRQNERYNVPKSGLPGGGGEVAGLVDRRVRHSLATVALVQYLAVVPAHGAPQVVGSFRRPVRAAAT